MIFGLHVLLYSKDADADRAFFRDVLELKGIDVGGGWLIFRTPPSELAVHPIEKAFTQSHGGHSMSGAILYFMCDDLRKTIKSLAAKKVKCTEVETENWGIRTTIPLPSGGEIGVYQPTHKVALKR
jgi:catechol 2,3-dioxygenase-like lactoylglutathione lyase family enzyme